MVDFSSEIFDLSSLGSNPTKETKVKSNVDKNRLPCVKTEDESRVILSKQEFWVIDPDEIFDWEVDSLEAG